MAPRTPPSKRLGRPPATDSADTRRRILDIARTSFAAGGYDSSTNRDLAAEIGLTAGALYHYFGSKLDLYVAVHDDLQQRIYGQFNEAVDKAVGFLGKFEAVLDTARVLNKEDPSLAAFLGVVRSDMRRHPEIREKLGEHSDRRDEFFVRLVDAGVANGEISKKQRPFVVEFVAMILIGLTDGVSDDPKRHERAVKSTKMALRGELMSLPTA
ncbi:MAG: TetR/AcrR family transcriptional regulator [Ilumatobacteraceae bacterium]